jgi:hypothetical protein
MTIMAGREMGDTQIYERDISLRIWCLYSTQASRTIPRSPCPQSGWRDVTEAPDPVRLRGLFLFRAGLVPEHRCAIIRLWNSPTHSGGLGPLRRQRPKSTGPDVRTPGPANRTEGDSD